ncbi:g9099 [Coccomyxa elongata]
MASQAFERAMKKLESPSETQLAELIMRDITQLSEDAKVRGVTAYLRKPVHRERPNERFLQGTLRSVAFANRKAEEDEMWVHRKKRLHGYAGVSRPSTGTRSNQSEERSSESESDSAERSSEAEPSGAISDSQLADMLSRHRPRGRGAVGSRVDEPGPFLPESALEDVGPDDFSVRGPAGPERPAWLQRDADNVGSLAESGGAALKSNLSDLVGSKKRRSDNSELKPKKRKKQKKEKRFKEKKRRKKDKG